MASLDPLPPDDRFTPLPPDDGGPLVRVTARRPPHPTFWWSILWCVGFDGFLFGTLIVVAIITAVVLAAASGEPREFLARFGKQDKEAVAEIMAPAFYVSEVASVLLALLVIRLVVGREWRRRLAFRLPSVPHLVLVLLAMPALLTLPGLLHQAAGQVLPSFGDTHETVDMFSQWPLWFGVLVVGVLPGIGEELWTRGFLGRGLVGRYGRFAGVVLTALFFGWLHLDPPYAVATAVMGLWLHYVYLTSRSLPLSMFLHFTNNSLAVILAHPEYKAASDWMEGGMNHVYVVVAAGGVLLAVAWALYQSRARLVADEGRPLWKPPFPGVEEPPRDSGTRVVRPWPGLVATLLVLVALAAFVWVFYLGTVMGDRLL